MTRRMTKTERIARERLTYQLWLSEANDSFDENVLRERVPEAWHMIEADVDCHEPKEKVTLYLDRSVARVFRAMGRGYQTRINRVLATWIQHRAAGLQERDRMIEKRMREVYGEGKV